VNQDDTMTVRIAITDGIGRLTLDHPPLNILTRAVLSGLRDALEQLRTTPDLRALLLTAEGKHFSAGADVGEHLPPEYREMIPEFIETVVRLDQFPLPVVVAVRGKCLGGGFELVQAADLVIAGESAVFGQPEIRLGVFPPAACALLPGLCNPGLAAQLILTGEPIGAPEAERAGLVRRVVPDAELEAASQELLGRFARLSGATLRAAKRALRAATPDRNGLLARAGRRYVEDLMCTDDALEGLRSFVEKRQPAWSHR
jgi:cyclohexa-1,5-dienecarbonyl-CoA hydratase